MEHTEREVHNVDMNMNIYPLAIPRQKKKLIAKEEKLDYEERIALQILKARAI